MTARDLDLVIGGAAIAFAAVLARILEPASAITILALTFVAAIAWLGDERVGAIWQAYCREPSPRRVRRASPPRSRAAVRADRRPFVQPRGAALPRARVVSVR